MQDLYEARNSIYCYKNSNVLINNLGIQNSQELFNYEAKITAAKLLILREKGITGNFDINHFIQIHRFLFEDIYPFAGLFRAENIAKDNFRFAQWEYLEDELKKILTNLKENNYLKSSSKKEFAHKLANHMADLNVLHPFRERKW